MDSQSQSGARTSTLEWNSEAADRERLRSLILQMPAPLGITEGPEHRFVLVNDSYKRVTGGGRDSIGLTPREAFPELADSGILERFDQVYGSGVSWVSEETLVRYDRDGTGVDDFWFNLRLDPVRDADGHVSGIINSSLDVTEQVRARRAVEALLAAERASRAEADHAREGTAAILNSIADPFLLLDREWHITHVNAAAEPPLQTSGSQLLGRTLWDAFPGLEGSAFESAYREAMATGHVRSKEDFFAPLNAWFDVRVYPWSGGLMVHFRDVSARVSATAERERLLSTLELERGRLAYVFQQAPAFLAVLRGPSYVFELVNDAYYQLVGHRELLGRPAFEAIPEVRDQGFKELLDGVVSTGEPWIGREVPITLVRTPSAPPEARYVDLIYLPLIEQDGSRSGVIAHGTDVTAQVVARQEVQRLLDESERARAHAELGREQTSRLQALTAALAGAQSRDAAATVVVADIVSALGARTGALALCAPEGDALILVRAVGFPEAEAARMHRQRLDLKSPLVDCYHAGAPIWIESRVGPDGLDARYPIIAPVWDVLGVESAVFLPLVAAGETVGAISFAFEKPRVFTAEERAFLLALAQQAALAVERARLFDAEHAARQQAESASRVKGEFLAVMSHELRTPLNAIGGYAELIELGIHGPVTEAQRTALDRIQQSQRHLLGLIAGVLDYSRVEAGAVTYRLANVPVVEAVAEAEVLLAPQLRAKGLGYAWSGAPPGLTVRADREKLQQILLNLLSNAVKFTHARNGTPGRIEVGCKVDAPHSGGLVHLFVRDTGDGIDAGQLERMFEPFVQVDQRLTRLHEGVGLGLAISRDLARGMGGDLLAESTKDRGSTFTLLLPQGSR